MSHSKREQSEFNHAVVAGRARLSMYSAPLAPSATANVTKLRVLDSWEPAVCQSGDPYNGIGARVLPGRELRK